MVVRALPVLWYYITYNTLYNINNSPCYGVGNSSSADGDSQCLVQADGSNRGSSGVSGGSLGGSSRSDSHAGKAMAIVMAMPVVESYRLAP